MPAWTDEIKNKKVDYAILTEERVVFAKVGNNPPVLADPVEELELCQEQLRKSREHIAKLIQAVDDADRVMEQVRQRLMWGNSDEAILNANTMLVQGRSRLQSGEFPVEEDAK